MPSPTGGIFTISRNFRLYNQRKYLTIKIKVMNNGQFKKANQKTNKIKKL